MNENEFRALYLRMRGDVYAFAARRLGSDQADDVVSETFEVIWRKRAMAPGSDENWAAWTIGIARNKIRQASRRRRPWLSICPLEQEPSRYDPIDDVVADSLLGRRIYAQLTDAQRELFDLAHLKVLTVEQAAAALGITRTAYTTRVSRLRALIQRFYEEQRT